jgi:hypothetical protein
MSWSPTLFSGCVDVITLTIWCVICVNDRCVSKQLTAVFSSHVQLHIYFRYHHELIRHLCGLHSPYQCNKLTRLTRSAS